VREVGIDLPRDGPEPSLVSVVGQKIEKRPATHGPGDPEMVAQELEQRHGRVVGDKDAERVFLVLEHAKGIAVSNLGNGIDGPIMYLLTQVHGDGRGTGGEVFPLNQIDECCDSLVGAFFDIDAASTTILRQGLGC